MVLLMSPAQSPRCSNQQVNEGTVCGYGPTEPGFLPTCWCSMNLPPQPNVEQVFIHCFPPIPFCWHSGHWGAFQSRVSPVYIQIRITIPCILLISLVVENLWEYGLENVGKFVKYSSVEYCDWRHLIGLHCRIFQIFHKIFHS